MKRKRYVSGLSAAITLAVSAFLLVHPVRARNADTMGESTQVAVDNFTFAPATLTVPVKSTVTWLNKDDVPHVIASDDRLFKSQALDTDDKYSYTFTKPGTYSYYCSVHPKMVGKIIVQ